MEIKRGNYYLCSDKACCWIEEGYINKKGNPDRRTISGYYPNFRMLAGALPARLLRSSEAKSMRKLVEDVKKLEVKLGKITLKKVDELVDDLDKPL